MTPVTSCFRHRRVVHPSRHRRLVVVATLVVVAGLFAQSGSAGMLVKMKTRSLLSGSESVNLNELMVEGENLRMKITGGEGDGDIIFRGDLQEMWIVDHERKQVMVMDRDGLLEMSNRIGAAMKQLEAALANVPEAQREMMEKLMKEQLGGSLGSGEAPPPREVTQKGRSEFAGRDCDLLEVSRAGEITAELCVIPFGEVDGGDEVARAFEAMIGFAEDLLEAVESTPIMGRMQMMGDSNPFALGTDYEGFPVMSRQFDEGALQTESVLESMVRESFAPTVFEAPDGYKPQSLGKMMERAGR